MEQARPAIYLITGPTAAGKSTVARLLAARFDRGVHLEGDVFRRSIVSGRHEPGPDARPDALEQLHLRYRIAAAAADTYLAAGFTVALEDVVAGALLGEYRTMIRGRPCHVVALMPSPAAVRAREARRRENGYRLWTAEQLYERFAGETPRVGIWLDTTEQTPEETVDAILAATPTARTPIVVAAYDRAWPELFECLAQPIRAALAELGAAVEHVGSTAVPGLAAKPVIDLDAVLPSAKDVPAAIERLRALGYVYQGNKGISGREAFLWPPGAPPHHLYVVVAGTDPHLRHIRFRNHLRCHPEAADAYAALKRGLVLHYADDPAGYTEAKSEFVDGILAAAAQAERQPSPRRGA